MLYHKNDRSLYGIPMGASVSILSIHPNATSIFPCDDKKLSSLLVKSLFAFDQEFRHSVHHINPWKLVVLDIMPTRDNFNIGWKLNELLSYKLRYFACCLGYQWGSISPSFVFLHLQTLILYSNDPLEVPIWNMPQLRHVKVETLHLLDPGKEEKSSVVLENLQSLSLVENFRCFKEVLQRIPNVKKLGISYKLTQQEWQRCHFYGLFHLCKLEVLKCLSVEPTLSYLDNLIFPPSLKKLTLEGCHLPWSNMVIVGSLPNLEVLKLKTCAFEGQEWEPTEGEFLKLKYLLLMKPNLEQWRADSIHFPRLQHLIINCCLCLDKIPCGIGEIPTLQLVELHDCNDSLIASATEMQEQQLEMGNDSLQVCIKHRHSMRED